MLNKKNIAAVIFAVFSVWLSTIAPTTSIAWMLGILVLTIYLFAFEVVEVDEAAITQRCHLF
jgi:ABC-type multidrug transport system permease subunit